MLVARGWDRGAGLTLLWGQSFRWGSWNALERDGGGGCTTMGIYSTSSTLKNGYRGTGYGTCTLPP